MRPILVRFAFALSLAVCAASGQASAAPGTPFGVPASGGASLPDDREPPWVTGCEYGYSHELAGLSVCNPKPRPWYRGSWVSYAAAVTLAGSYAVTARAHWTDRPKRLAFPLCLAFWLLAGFVALVA